MKGAFFASCELLVVFFHLIHILIQQIKPFPVLRERRLHRNLLFLPVYRHDIAFQPYKRPRNCLDFLTGHKKNLGNAPVLAVFDEQLKLFQRFAADFYRIFIVVQDSAKAFCAF